MRSAECGIKQKTFFTALGWAGLAVTEKGICGIVLPKKSRNAVDRELKRMKLRGRSCEEKADRLLNSAVLLLKKYFSGNAVQFDLPIDIRYYTGFQQSVWRAAMRIPLGKTRSYAWIANRIKKPNAARAVGQAMGANPVPILIP
jgi:O6-methylguanine-DNA--protein-cysteine methyltransferase